ncbi:MAG: hypothetical protein ABI889_02860 [Gemmatimonadota bacterium]
MPLITIALASASLRAQDAAAPPDLNANFVGNWAGQLEYRDYSSNERVFLPTWLAITESVDHRSLDFSYVYDDGPNKTVRERMAFRLDAAASKATLTDFGQTSKDTSSTQSYDVSGLDEFGKTGRGVLHLAGVGMDGGKRVDVRLTITLRRNLYSWRKDVRPAGDTDERSYQFRDGYVFTRVQAPAEP